MKETFGRYETADYLKTEADITAYLEACSEEKDPVLMAAALGDVAKARKAMSAVARKAGISREKALSK